jgi:hypothetical protein
MTGGILQIVAYGVEDLFIMGDPQITFFKTVYRRHTNFSRTEINLKFNNKINFGKEGKCKIQRFGDLLHRLFLVIQLPRVDIVYRSVTVGEVKTVLSINGITWNTDKSDDEIFDQDAFEEVSIAIDDEIDSINDEINTIDEIIPLLENDLSPQAFFDQGGTNEDVIEYFDFVIERLIEFDENEFQYKFINAHAKDREPFDLPLVNSFILQKLLLEDFTDFVTGKTTFYPMLSLFNHENLFFIFNTDTANYIISGSVDQVTSDTVFRSGIANAYGNEPFDTLDAFKIFDQTLIDRGSLVNSNFDIQIIKDILLINERIGLIKNPKLLKNIYNSLDDDFKFIFYKKLNRENGIVKSTDSFINLSQISTTVEEFRDNFKFDFELPMEDGETSDVKHPFGVLVEEQKDIFYRNNRDVFRISKFVDYYNDFNLWTRLNVGDPGNELDNFEELCKTEIEALFEGNIPDSLRGMNDLSYIPLFTANDIPIAVSRHLNNRINEEDNTDIPAWADDLRVALDSTKDSLIAELLPFMCLDDTILTQNRLSNFRTTVGNAFEPLDGDLIHHAIIRHDIFLTFGDKKLTLPEYVMARMIDTADSFGEDVDGYDDYFPPSFNPDGQDDVSEKDVVIRAINLFAVPTDQMLSRASYALLINNSTPDITINNGLDPDLSDAISSIWHNILPQIVINFNNFYDENILNRQIFIDSIGDEMKSYLDYISDTYFNSPPVNNPDPINYWFNTIQSDLPINGGPIGTFLEEKIVTFDQQLQKFDNNRRLLDIKSLLITRETFYFEEFRKVLNEIIDNNVEKTQSTNPQDPPGTLLYDHENHGITSLDPVIDTKNRFISGEAGNPQHNARDIFGRNELTSDRGLIDIDFETVFLLSTSNPYDIATNKFELWNEFNNTIPKPSPSEEEAKWRNLFAIFNAPEIFKRITIINAEYNGFVDEKDVYRFMKDLVVDSSFFKPLLPLRDDTVVETHANILNFYNLERINLEEQLASIEGDEDNPSLKIRLLNTLSGGSPANFAWIQKLGHYMIEHLSIKIGGQLIDKHYGEWLNIWHELIKKDSKERGYKILIGDVPELTTFNEVLKDEYEIIVPLQFWFCRHIGSSLPIVALQHTDIELSVKFRDFDDISFSDEFVLFSRKPRLKCEILAEYIYIEKDERTNLVKSKLEYLIDTLQFSGDGLVLSKVFFQNPITELFWLFQDRTFLDGSRPSGEKKYHLYGLDFDTGKINPLDKAKIEFSNRDRELFKEANYYNFIQPYQYHSATPPIGVNMYSFSLSPEFFQPSGSANFSKIDDANIVFKLKDEVINNMRQFGLEFRFVIYATSYNVLRVMSGQAGLAFFQ